MQGNNAIRSGIFSSIIQFIKGKIGNVKKFATVVSYLKSMKNGDQSIYI